MRTIKIFLEKNIVQFEELRVFYTEFWSLLIDIIYQLKETRLLEFCLFCLIIDHCLNALNQTRISQISRDYCVLGAARIQTVAAVLVIDRDCKLVTRSTRVLLVLLDH